MEYRNIDHTVVCLTICIFWSVLVIQTIVDDNIYNVDAFLPNEKY